MSENTHLVADIGATHTRMALAGPNGRLGPPVRLRTGEHADAVDLLRAGLALLAGATPAGCCLAIAGPVVDGVGRLTNGRLEFDQARLGRELGAPVRVVNDFHALARGLPALRDLHQLGGGAPAHGVKAVLGPGSGLGMGVLVPHGAGWLVLPSEGGHADLAPGTPLEAELVQLLQFEHGHVSWETVLCGPGLVNLYRAMCRLWGTEPEPATPEWITQTGVDAAQPICHQTLEVFFGLLGSAAGNLAVTVCARGGVYLAGGILPQLAGFAAASPLRRRFEERGNMSALVRDIPLYLIRDPDPGLVGALACLDDD
ncbi:MAG: glucokinase [Pseudomonadales bacterium]|nr:glucokinase [Pseudomonadales bacterium]